MTNLNLNLATGGLAGAGGTNGDGIGGGLYVTTGGWSRSKKDGLR